MKINRYVDISTIDREAKKDYIDRHSPFIHCGDKATAGEKFKVTVKMGDEYPHPDDFDHYIAWVQLCQHHFAIPQLYPRNVVVKVIRMGIFIAHFYGYFKFFAGSGFVSTMDKW